MLTDVKDKLNELMQEKTTPKKREYYSYPVVDSKRGTEWRLLTVL